MNRKDFAASVAALFASTARGIASTPTYHHFKGKAYHVKRHPHVKKTGKLAASADDLSTVDMRIDEDWGPPVFFRWNPDTGTVVRNGTHPADESKNILPADTKTALVTFHFHYVNVDASYFPSRRKEVAQFRPAVHQSTAFPALKDDKLSWGVLYAPRYKDGVLKSHELPDKEFITLENVPIVGGEGFLQCSFAGIALNQTKFVVDLDAILHRVNKALDAVGGHSLVPIGATTIAGLHAAMSTVDAVATAVADPSVEYVINMNTVRFAVTKETDTTDPDTLRIESPGQNWIIVPEGYVDSFISIVKSGSGVVFAQHNGIGLVGKDNTVNDNAFANVNYLTMFTTTKAGPT